MAFDRQKWKAQVTSQESPGQDPTEDRQNIPSQKEPRNTTVNKSYIDKEAIRRNPSYQADFEQAFESYRANLSDSRDRPSHDLINPFQLAPEGQALCQRWGLTMALHPDDKLWSSAPECFFKDLGQAVIVKPQGGGVPIDENGFVDHGGYLSNGRYLTVEIDLLAKNEQIVKAIQNIVDAYQQALIEKEVQRRAREIQGPLVPECSLSMEDWARDRRDSRKQWLTKIRKQVERDKNYKRRDIARNDIDLAFQVWDMHHKDGKTLLQIMGEFYPEVKGVDPNNDGKAQATYQQIRRLYKKAATLIQNADK